MDRLEREELTVVKTWAAALIPSA